MRVIVTKRIYDGYAPNDGFRVLVDRVWPRGLTKEKAAIDHWAKDIAPSTELRRWFGHDPARWPEFQGRYRAELAGEAELLRSILEMSAGRNITLLQSGNRTKGRADRICRLEKRTEDRITDASSFRVRMAGVVFTVG